MVGRVLPLSASLALLLAAAPLQAQLTEVQEQHRFEIIPVAGYVWGGSYETDASSAFPAGHLRISPSFAWGGIISFLAHGGSAADAESRAAPMVESTAPMVVSTLAAAESP